jgi:two-component system sensor histidine kinase DegS
MANGSEVVRLRDPRAALFAFTQRYGEVFEYLNDAVIVYRLNGDIVYANEAVSALTGFNREDLQGKNVGHLLSEEDFGHVMERQQQQIEGEAVSQRYELVWIRRDGTRVIGESVTRLIDDRGEPLGVLAITKNITEQKRIEEALRQERDKAQRYLDVAGVAIQVIDENQRIALMNRKSCAILGYKSDEVIGRNWFDLVTPARNRPKAKTIFNKLVAGGIELGRCHESQVMTKNGEERTIAWYNTTLLRDGPSRVIGVLGSGEDITERRQMEKALLESEERYRSLFENSKDAICIVSRDLEVIDVNQAALDLFGYSRGEMKGLDIQASSVDGAQGKRFQKQIEHRGYVSDYEMKLRKKDNTEIDCLLTFTARYDDSGKVTRLEGIIRDVTEQKRMQENLLLYLREITRTQEEERKRIARELHDGAVQDLATLVLDIEAIATARRRLPIKVLEDVERVRNRVSGIAEDLSRLSRALRPSALDRLGLVPAVKAMLYELRDTGKMAVKFEVVGRERRLRPEAELGLFRIVQEATNNARKHSAGSTLNVSIRFRRDGAAVTIADDGKGFEPPRRLSDLAAKGQLGLVGMQERAQLLNGSFSIESGDGQGTTVRVDLGNGTAKSGRGPKFDR